MRKLIIVLFITCSSLFLTATVNAGEALDEVIKIASAAPWKANAATIKKSLGREPLFENKAIMIAPSRLADRDATINYLFNKSDALYNLAWYLTIPTAELDAAQDFEKALEAALKAKYGKPKRVFSDGDLKNAEKTKKQAEEMARILAPSLKKDLPPSPPDGSRSFIIGKDGEIIIPMIFYSKMNFWDGGKFWVYSNFLCSTDGKCYLHLQFVSKALTKKEGYAPNTKAFAYSPLDRDQDLVTKHNDMMEYNQTTQSAP